MTSSQDLIHRYLLHVRFEKRLADRTVSLYTEDLHKLNLLAQEAGLTSLTLIDAAHLRRWMAHMHSSGRSPRGIALILSGWRGFFHWLGKEGLILANPLSGLRAPKAAKPLPSLSGYMSSNPLILSPKKRNSILTSYSPKLANNLP